ncbi:MAG TPA: EsaB/YukD family protein, partial [Pseudonocardia sp.]|nr:EsaB/YukD family protein [Pseudonocardia sp.]
MPSGVTDAGFCLVTVLTPRATWDVALPVDVPVAELVPMVLELVGEPVFGIRPQPWRLSGMGGGPLPPERSLRELGVLDGELLRIAPAGPPPPAPVLDDPVDAVAATTSAAPRDERRFRAVAALLLTLAAALVLAAGPLALLAQLTAPPLVIDAV